METAARRRCAPRGFKDTQSRIRQTLGRRTCQGTHRSPRSQVKLKVRGGEEEICDHTGEELIVILFPFSGIPKNGSVPTFDRVRKHSTGDRFKPSLAAIKASSRADVENGEVRMNEKLIRSTHSLTEGRTQNPEDSVSSNSFTMKFPLIG